MNRRVCGLVAYLLLGVAMLQGCAAGTPTEPQPGTLAVLAVPTSPSGSPVARPSPVAPDGNSTPSETAPASAGVATPSGSPAAKPTPIEPGTNITQAEYETALAKWRARGVAEYEITL